MEAAQRSNASEAAAREQTRLRIIDAAIGLLERKGRDAVTTRAVAEAAGVQPPALYRFFGNKDGLLEAVAEHGFTRFLAAKHIDLDSDDPIKDLRTGWDIAVEFGVTNPGLYVLMYGEPAKSTTVFRIGLELLMDRLHRLAAKGWLRVDEDLGALIIHATACGAVLTWLALPEEQRNPALLDTMRESMITTVTNQEPVMQKDGAAGAARALRAALPRHSPLSHAEQQLLTEWLTRLSVQSAVVPDLEC